MRRKFLSFLLALLFANGSFATDAVMELGEKYSTDDVTVNGKPAIKLGRSTGGGDMRVTVGAGAKVLTLHVVAWNKEGGAKLLIEAPDGVGIDPAEIELVADVNVSTSSGNDFTIEDEDAFKFEITLSGIEAETKLTLTSEKRCVIWGATYETESTGTEHETIPTTAPLAPTHDETGVKAVYCNYYMQNNLSFNVLNWGVTNWQTLYLNGTNVMYTQTMVWDAIGDYNAHDVSAYKKLHFDIWVPQASQIKLTVEALSGERHYANFNLNEGWNSINANLELMDEGNTTYDWKDVTYLIFEGYKTADGTESLEGNPFAFANIYFYDTSKCLLASGCTQGAQGNNFTWELSCNGVLTISGTGAMLNDSPWLSYNSSVASIVIEDGVTWIGSNAFQNCTGLTSVTIPNSVTSIGSSAFRGCSSLTSVTIPNSVTSIGRRAFNGCYSLTSITVENGNPTYDSRENCNAIIENTFNTLIVGCQNTIIPNSVTSIGGWAFQDCIGLKSIDIPNSITSIGSSAFQNCTGLTSVSIGNSVTSIGDGAFYGCSSLTSIEIPNSVTSIGESVFSGCSSLPVINNIRYADTYLVGAVDKTLSLYSIKEGTKWIGTQAFEVCSNLTSIEIPNSVTSIKYAAFAGCTGLTSLTIPNSVTTLGGRAFSGCSGLTSIEIPNSVTSIGVDAFYGCTGLTTVTIPNSVISIEYEAFFDCTGLTSVICEAVTPPDLGEDVFSGVHKTITLYVPAESVDAYKAADQWKDFNVQAIPGTGPCITATGTCGAQGDNLTWELSCDGVLTITGTGEMYNYGYQGASDFIFAPWNEYRESILSVIIEEGVTSIGRSAFEDCTSLTSVTIPSSITYIGELAFIVGETFADLYISNLAAWCNINFDGQPHEGCNPLFFAKNFYISGTKVVDVVIPESITSINNCALCVNFDNELAAIHSITFESATPPTIGDYYTFSYNTDLFVPCGALETYLSADNWSQYENRIQNAPSPYNIIVTPWGKGHIQQSEISVCGINIEAIPDEGYYFTKWSDGVTENPRTIVLTQDSSIMAEFLINRYRVEFKDWNETLLKVDSVDYNSAASAPNPPVREHYTFIGWDEEFEHVTSDLIVFAQYEINRYQVIFFGYDGSILSEQMVAYDSAAKEPEIPQRDGYTFTGWTTEFEHITERTFVLATYEKNVPEGIPVTYKDEDGEVIFSENVDLHLPDVLTLEGKTFAGWITESIDKTNGIVLRATYTLDNPTTNSDVTVVPGSNTAGVTFPYITGALTYVLVVRDLSGSVVCKIMFNATGHLLGIAFAPARGKSQKASQETGFNFTIEGLESETTYEYEFVAFDNTDEVIETLSGSFTTTAAVPTDGKNVLEIPHAIKFIQQGNVYIQRGDKLYTLTGQEVK